MTRKTKNLKEWKEDAENYRIFYVQEREGRVKAEDMLRDSEAKIVELEGEILKLRQETKILSKFIEDLHCAHRLMGSLFREK